MRQYSQPANSASDPQIRPPIMAGETWPRSVRPDSGWLRYQQWTCQTRDLQWNRRKAPSLNLLRLASPDRFSHAPRAIHGIPRRVAEFRAFASSSLEWHYRVLPASKRGQVRLPGRPGTDRRLVGCFAQRYLTPFWPMPASLINTDANTYRAAHFANLEPHATHPLKPNQAENPCGSAWDRSGEPRRFGHFRPTQRASRPSLRPTSCTVFVGQVPVSRGVTRVLPPGIGSTVRITIREIPDCP